MPSVADPIGRGARVAETGAMDEGGRAARRGLRDAWRLARSRERAAPRRASLAALAALVAALGGLSLGSIAMARRTADSFSAYLASTHPSTLLIEPVGGRGLTRPGEAQRLTRAVARYPGVTRVESAEGIQTQRVVDGRPVPGALDSEVLVEASVTGLFADMDRFTLTAGRRPNPVRAGEVLTTPLAARVLGLHVGSTLDVLAGPKNVPVGLRVVGEGVPSRSIVQDEVARYPTYVLGTPALARLVGSSGIIYIGARVAAGDAGVGAVEHRWDTTERFFTDFQLTSQTVSEADQSLRPLALALGAFGAIAGAAGLLLAMQSLSRRASARRRDREVLRALGASTLDLVVDGLPGALGALVVGAVGAGALAVALSPLGPLGPVRPYLAHRGLSVDPLVLGVGVPALAVVLVAAAVALSARHAPPRADRGAAARARRPVVSAALSRSGVPVSAATGARFALEGGRGRDAPGRWAMAGSVVALAVLGATLTFGESLNSLAAHPALYGWNWDYGVESSFGYGPVPAQSVGHAPGVTTSGASYVTMLIDGVEVPTLLTYPRSAVAPPVVAGHALDGRGQIVLGEATLAQLHARLGSVVDVVYAPGFPKPPLRLKVVGEATMPAIGISEGLHTSMGVGAIVPANADKVTEQLGPHGYGGNCNGPNIVFVRAGPGHAAAALAAARGIARRANAVLSVEPNGSVCSGNVASVVGVLRPAQIVNYRTMGTTPLLLAGGLALGALAALAAALVSSVARRRRELAILKSLGVTQRQLTAAVAWQAGITAVVGVVVGLPLGVALGRWLWGLFAREIGAVPSPSVSLASLALVAAGAVAVALVTALAPGRRAAATPAADALHRE